MLQWEQVSSLCVNKLLRDIVKVHYRYFCPDQIKRYELVTTEVKDFMIRKLQTEGLAGKTIPSFTSKHFHPLGNIENTSNGSEKSESSLQTNVEATDFGKGEETSESNDGDSAYFDEAKRSAGIPIVNKEAEMKFKENPYFFLAKEKLYTNNIVFLTGNPGEGKSTVAHQCVAFLNDKTPNVVLTPEDLFRIEIKNNLAILIDGLFDQIAISDVAKSLLKKLSFMLFKNNSNKIIVVMQNEVFNFLKNKYRELELWNEIAIINFSHVPPTNASCIIGIETKDERTVKAHSLQKSILNFQWLYKSSHSKVSEQMSKELSSRAVNVLKVHFKNMEHMPLLVISFIAMNGVLRIDEFQDGLPSKNFFENLSILTGGNCNRVDANVMKEIAKAFEGIYLVYEERFQGYLCIDKYVLYAICSVLYEKNPWKFIDMCPVKFLAEISTEDQRKRYYICTDKLRRVALRILSELKKRPTTELFQNLWKSQIWENTTFIKLIDKKFCMSIQDLSADLQKEFFGFSKTYTNVALVSYLLIHIPNLMIKQRHTESNASKVFPLKKNLLLEKAAIDYDRSAVQCFCKCSRRPHTEECSMISSFKKSINRVYSLKEDQTEQLSFDFQRKEKDSDIVSHKRLCWSRTSQKKYEKFEHQLLNIGIEEENEKYISVGTKLLGFEGLKWLETVFNINKNHKSKKIKEILKSEVIKAFLRIHGGKYKIVRIWIGKRFSMDYVPKLDTLVIIHNTPNSVDFPETFLGLALLQRGIDEVSTEAKSLLKYESKRHSRDLSITSGVISSLFALHTNITLISTSSVRSKGYKTTLEEIEDTPCIVIYCMIKGVIPDGETCFPSTVEGNIVDVREGICSFANNTEPLRIGDKIFSDRYMQYGTLGGFVDIGPNTKGFITCAHVLCSNEALRNGNYEKYFKKQEHFVYDSSENASRDEHIGKVHEAVILHNDPNKVSVDAAVVQITSRFPENGEFTDQYRLHQLKEAGFSSSQLPNFSNGEIDAITSMNFGEHVIKIGAKSGLTVGSLGKDRAYATIEKESTSNIPYRYPNPESDYKFKMYRQKEVFPLKSTPFFEKGDSGAFIFMVTKNNPPELRCIGLGVAATTYGSCIMTPIKDVLDSLRLDHDSLTKFQSQSGSEEAASIQKGPDTLQNLLSNEIQMYMQNFNGKLTEIISKLKTNEESTKKMENTLINTDKTLENIQEQMNANTQSIDEIKKRVSSLENR